ncbi:transglycosylase SLT domain-containing protein [Methylobacterium sp. J-076]|uniref:transglycosylase SLT domain-containing protein n=1 Tax=Methylobacterium sp. J-076 TaxID=2836655 RepID=UPI001FB8CF03|nr:transglycosylase SLT domain-containing protein [Methylobacterium sp. J-076]MCJ2011867.1 transglycosylase SLT domain-containing protein [Methylobacterium sp. J-076]
MTGPGTSLTEEDCIDEVMRLRYGDAPCTACGSRQGFVRKSRNRAFSCRSCGLKVFPCQGTPFAKARPALTEWFRAVDIVARERGDARTLRRRLALDRGTAAGMMAGVARLKAASDPAVGHHWFSDIAAFAAARLQPAERGAAPADSGRETNWESLHAVAASFPARYRPFLGLGMIAALMLVGIGIGWLIVPQQPPADEEVAQATAILSLGEDKPVILVSPEVAAQLYDVIDVDGKPPESFASSIRIAPTGPGPAGATTLAPPTVRLSDGAGQSLAQGDLGAVKASARERPELAAYSALANELEGKGPRNPDELLAFGPMRIRRYLVEKIVRASRVTNVDPVLLMAIADKESSFKTEVQAQTSSASGLYQFIEKTWLGVVREFGASYGLEREAAMIANGEAVGPQRARILTLRSDPYLSAVLAARMLKRDSLRIAARIGRNLTGGEVYLVHFLGPDGAERMIGEIARKPNSVAADLLPKPAAANKPIFYGEGGSKSLSVSEVRSKFETMISLRLNRYNSVRTVSVPQTPEVRVVPVTEQR